ncbi:hypothetical protein DPMN_127190, partial [Dreissena polymorpha]
MLDLQKAFDTVDHDILCRKLRAMGVESVEWFRSYLADRTHMQTMHQHVCRVKRAMWVIRKKFTHRLFRNDLLLHELCF